MNSKDRDRYIRWQEYRIQQLSFLINLFLTFSIASLAFAINIKLELKNENWVINNVICIWATSAAIGTLAPLFRLIDFRYTAEKIREGNRFNSFVAEYFGKIAWGAFWSQIALYVIGAYSFLIYFVFDS